MALSIADVYGAFPSQDDCLEHLERVRWPKSPACPYCRSSRSSPLPKQRRHHCNACNTTFSVTVGTIFHHTHMPLQKWFLAVALVLNAKKGLSSRQMGRDLGVHRNTAWRILMQIRHAMIQQEQRELLQGVVEMDETFRRRQAASNS